MAEYIDRDEVIAWIWKQKRLSKGYTVMVIQDLPAADVAPVRHGRWIDNGIQGSMLSGCSVCGFTCGAYTFKYCPNCGARMTEDIDEQKK